MSDDGNTKQMPNKISVASPTKNVLKRPLKLETREVYEDKYTPCENKDGESADEGKTVVDTEEKDGVFTAVNTENADEISQNDDNGALNDDKDLANDDKK